MTDLITEARELCVRYLKSGWNIPIAFLNRVNELCDALEKAQAANAWIPVTERLPDGQQDVLIWFDRCGGDIGIGYRSKDKDAWFMLGGMMLCYNVTHWMPLPVAPKGDSRE